MQNKKTDIRLEYRSCGYGIYHNALIDIKKIITTSASAQDKVDAILQEVCNAQKDAMLDKYKLGKKLGAKN